jgi:GNAT superfamily N-acetyltransferase
LGRALLHFLEQEAARLSYSKIILETGAVNDRAVRFYLENGYTVCENYDRYIDRDESVCFIKAIHPGEYGQTGV